MPYTFYQDLGAKFLELSAKQSEWAISNLAGKEGTRPTAMIHTYE